MSEQGPFDAATLCLGASRCMFNNQGQVEITNAIRFLGAAVKIAHRRDEILGAMDRMTPNADGNVNLVYNLTKDLIEALPDGGKK